MSEWRRTLQAASPAASPSRAPSCAVRPTWWWPTCRVFVLGIVDDHARKLHWGHGISCHVDVLRPFSRSVERRRPA
ncbi:MAG: hypothetical protein U1F25_01720 [Rubrivivax sp.]